MNILVVDGQGGGIGSRIITELRAVISEKIEVIAVGTNALATKAMLKAGADAGVTGENPVVFNAARADIILGPIGIILANSMLGEITPSMAAAIAASDAQKVLIPFSKCSVTIAGVENRPMDSTIKQAAEIVIGIIKDAASGR